MKILVDEAEKIQDFMDRIIEVAQKEKYTRFQLTTACATIVCMTALIENANCMQASSFIHEVYHHVKDMDLFNPLLGDFDGKVH